jgi:predicted permease
MQTLRDALRTTVRGAVARPGFALLVVLTFAVGIGANTAIFTVADATLRRGLPYPASDELVAMFETRDRQEFERMELSYPNYLDWRASMRSFAGIGGYTDGRITLATPDGAEMVKAGFAMGDFFRVLGAPVALGRPIAPADEQASAARAVVLSHAGWQNRFGGDPAVVGRTITVGSAPATIVGVLAPGFAFGLVDGPELWLAMRPEGDPRERRNLHWVDVIARLAPGVSREQAQAEASAVAARLAQSHPDANRGAGALVTPLADEILGKARPIMLLLLGAAGLVLLIACANIANLLLARQTTRTKELAIRAALGASRARLVGLLTAEAVVYALVGGAAGLLLAVWALDAIVGSVPGAVLRAMPFLAGASADALALALTFFLALATGVGVGIVSAMRAARPELAEALKREGRGASVDPGRVRLRDALVVSEVALAFVLLAGAGLVARSMFQVLAVDPGFDPHQLVTARVSLPAARYGDDARARAGHDEILARLAALPRVRGAASVSTLPLGDGGNTIRFAVEGQAPPPRGTEPEANIRDVSPGYFDTMGVLLLDGRAFDTGDRDGAEQVVIVNRTLADREFPAGAVGRHLTFTFAPTERPRRIVGVVGDESMGPLDAPAHPAIYTPFAQAPGRGFSLVVRGPITGNDVTRAVRELDASIPVYEVDTMEHRMAQAPWMFVRRFPAMLVGAFAAIALLLTAIGIYGVLSYTVRQRTHEIGIRRAVGAGRPQILRLILGRVAVLAGTGLAIGTGAALVGTRLLTSLLFGVSPWDPTTFTVVGAGLLATALVASWLPLRTALRVDPAEALRAD